MKISVIIPMYNSEDVILNTLNSVKAQTYSDLEIIVINDGSTDTSKEIVIIYIQNNIDLNIILLDQKNQGVSSARNAGLKRATGEWIALLDSDDEWLPNKLETQLRVINNHPGIDFLGTGRDGEIIKSNFFKKIGYLTQIFPKDLLYKMYFITPTVLFNKSILIDVGDFDKNQSFCEDGLFFLKVSLHKKCFFLNESLIYCGRKKAYFGERGLSSNLWKMQKGELSNLKYALRNRIINFFEFVFIYLFSMLKYFRRVILVKKSAMTANV